MAKIKRTLDKPKEGPKPPFNMAAPNDDLHAFGWDMGRIRYPAKDSTPNDVWPGRSIFDVDSDSALQKEYGFNIDFLNAKYLQVLFDRSPKIMAACQKAAQEKYSENALANLRKVIMAEFRDTVLPDIEVRFKKISNMICQFYAARMAHMQTFGDNDEA